MAGPTSVETSGRRMLAALAFFACLLLTTASQTSAENRSRVVMVIAGGISVRDLMYYNLGNVLHLCETRAVGLMNVRTGKPTKDCEPAARPGTLAGCLTLGAGTMASGGMEVSRAYDATTLIGGETAGSIYLARTGVRCSDENVLHTEIVRMQRVNEAASYRARPGALGATLHKAGIRTAVIGNSDLPDEVRREAVAAAMDESGKVDMGTVSSPMLCVPDEGSAYGVRTDTAFVARQAETALRQCRFVVVDFGDTMRADLYCDSCTDSQARQIRFLAARRLDDLIGRLRKLLDPDRDLLIVLSPSARTFSEIEGERLAPIVVSGPSFSHGLLTSPSTRQTGVVTLSDVTATIADFFGVETPAGSTGRPMLVKPERDTESALLRLNLAAANHAQRQVAMRGGSVFQSVIVVLATLALVLGAPARWKRAAAWAATLPAILPLAMLCVTPIYSGGLIGSVAVLVGLIALMLGTSILLFRSPRRVLVWLCGLLVVALAVDLALGAHLVRWSMAGYSLVEGARYYGIGNELMGSMLGAALVCLGLAFAGGAAPSKVAGLAAAAAYAVVFFVIAAPFLGANAGGAVAGAVGFVTALLLQTGWKPSVRGAVVVALVCAAAVIGVLALDAGDTDSSQSHVGRALALATSGEGGGLVSIVARKLELNFMLVSTSLWSRLLGLSLAASAALWWLRPRPERNRELTGALAGLVAGTAAAFLFNDSGVLAAAASAVMMWAMLAVCSGDE